MLTLSTFLLNNNDNRNNNNKDGKKSIFNVRIAIRLSEFPDFEFRLVLVSLNENSNKVTAVNALDHDREQNLHWGPTHYQKEKKILVGVHPKESYNQIILGIIPNILRGVTPLTDRKKQHKQDHSDLYR